MSELVARAHFDPIRNSLQIPIGGRLIRSLFGVLKGFVEMLNCRFNGNRTIHIFSHKQFA
jgi:hypothetical protein